MSGILKENKIIEMTVNLKQITQDDSWRWKAAKGIKKLKRFIQKQFRSEDEVLIAPELNKAIWARGLRHVPNRIRVRVERCPSTKNAEMNVFKVSYVSVSSFKGLISQATKE